MKYPDKYQKLLFPNYKERLRLMGNFGSMYMQFIKFNDDIALRPFEEEILIHQLSHIAEQLTPLNEIIDEFVYSIKPGINRYNSRNPSLYQIQSIKLESCKAEKFVRFFEDKYEYVADKESLYDSIMTCTPEHWMPVDILEFKNNYISSNIETLFGREVLKQSSLIGTQLEINFSSFELRMLNYSGLFKIFGKLREEFLIEAIEKFTRYSHPAFRSLLTSIYLTDNVINPKKYADVDWE